MRREGTNEDNVQMSDVMCDFCKREWNETTPMVEGHRGSCICGSCLSVAYRAVVLDESAVTSASPGEHACRLCLEKRTDPSWSSPAEDDCWVCRRCIKQAAAVLAKDKDLGWTKPTL